VTPQGFGSFSPVTGMHDAGRDAKEHEDEMDSRLNALIVEARGREIACQSARPRFDATATRALARPRPRSSPRRRLRRFLRRRLATQE
jgi:hypothetical protein